MGSEHTPTRLKANAPTVLVVEEEVLVRLSIAEYLRDCGFVVLEAASAVEAKSILLADEKCDVVFADVQASGEMGGFAFAQWVRRRRPHCVLILTATVAGKSRAAAELCDQHALSPKPCEHAQLSDRIHAMMAKRARKARSPRAYFGGARVFARARKG